MDCSNCGLSIRKDNRTGVCARSSCLTAYHAARYTNNPENGKARSRKYTKDNPGTATERKYGMQSGQYRKMLNDQGNCCAICGKTSQENGRKLAVDHDHSCCSGTPACGECNRALLCHRCNRLLGMVDDNPNLLIGMAAYLVSHEISERI